MILHNFQRLLNQTKPVGLDGTTPSSAFYASAAYNAICGKQIGYQNTIGGYGWIELGFGDTAEDYDNYNLADSNYSNAKLTGLTMSAVSKGNKELFNVIGSFRNNTANNVVVKEIGWICSPHNAGSGAALAYLGLLTRKVLDTPITMAPGDTYSFNYIIRLKDA